MLIRTVWGFLVSFSAGVFLHFYIFTSRLCPNVLSKRIGADFDYPPQSKYLFTNPPVRNGPAYVLGTTFSIACTRRRRPAPGTDWQTATP